MEHRRFGKTELDVSAVGFGAWGIGGPAMAGRVPIGWGSVDDRTSLFALRHALDRGITFYDTADFYGLGHSEELIGRVFGNRGDVVIATKVGHTTHHDGSLRTDYSRDYILQACERSLKRLNRESIDFYQLHSARVSHLGSGGCLEAMERLLEQGKIRAWGISLNTFHPEPEAEYLMQRNLGHGLQLVLNIVNQRAIPLLGRAHELGYGIIARMPLQFGLLTGKFSRQTRFEPDDHRSFRLPPQILERALEALRDVWPLAENLNMTNTALSLSYCLSFPQISTVIPGIKTPGQVDQNTDDIRPVDRTTLECLRQIYTTKLTEVVELMEKQG